MTNVNNIDMAEDNKIPFGSCTNSHPLHFVNSVLRQCFGTSRDFIIFRQVNLSGSSVLCITENIIKVYQFHDNL